MLQLAACCKQVLLACRQVVDTAVANADRYYRLVAMGMASRSGDAEWEAALFKAAAAQWLAEKKANSSLNALLQIFEARPCAAHVEELKVGVAPLLSPAVQVSHRWLIVCGTMA